MSQILWGTPRPTKKPPRRCGFLCGAGAPGYEPRAGVLTVKTHQSGESRDSLWEGRGGRLRVIAVAQHRVRLPYAPEALSRASLVGCKSQRVETVFGQASAAQSSLLASATCSGGAPPAGRQRPVGRFERSHVGAQALESLRGDAHLQLIVARVQG